jgi:autotransporter family porin
VNASGGPIIADGSNAIGILADSGTIRNTVKGRPLESATGPVQVTANNISTLGEFGTAISATGGSGGVTVNISSGGSIMGGWQADVTSVGSAYGLRASGVVLGSSAGIATLTNDGTIGALSDRAVASTPLFASNNTSIINDGTIAGFVQLAGSNNSIINNGTFNLRHFADTNGDGVRDTLRVAVSDLGPGAFTNIGTLALLGGPGAITLDATGQYLPLGLTFNAMTLGGPVQGQILGATTFTNSGTIDLQANPVPGDVLLISGGHTPGSNGGGTFISNGGRLLLDTVLNEGGANSQSDVLVVDNAIVGAGGPTGISVRNAGGPGALTPGNGILVVQGLGTTAPGTFSLAAPVEAGAFSYLLFHGSVDSTGPQNWYLRSTLNCALAPEDPACAPEPTPPQSPPLVPNFRPAVPLYTAMSPLATRYGFDVIGTLHERMGDPYTMVDSGGAPTASPMYFKAAPAAAPTSPPPAIWGRLFGDFGKRDNDSFLATGPDYTWSLGGVQSGFDLWRREWPDGARDHAGLYGAFGTIDSDVQRVFRSLGPTAGSIIMNAASLGGYWTHYGPSGWYIDVVTQGTFYDSNAQSVTGPALRTHGLGWAASFEGGYPIALSARVWLEPQAQLIYQRVRFDDGSDADALVSFNDSDALEGRLGARLIKTWDIGAPAQPRPLATWLRVNLWHEFLDGGDTTFAGLTGANAFTFAAPLKGTWAEIGGGATGAIAHNTTLFATAAYQHNVDGDHQYSWTGRAGVTVRW